MGKDLDVMIIGGGVIGLCSAYYLRRAGYRILLTDQDQVAGHRSSSYGNAGYIGPSGSMPLAEPGIIAQGLGRLLDREGPFHIKPRPNPDLWLWLWRFRRACRHGKAMAGFRVLYELKTKSLALFRDLVARESMGCELVENGKLVLFKTRQAHAKGRALGQLVRQGGGRADCLTRSQLRTILPIMGKDMYGGMLFKDDGHLHPQAFCRQMTRLLAAMGVELRSFCRTFGFTARNGRVETVETTSGVFRPRQVVLAAGIWSPRLARLLGIRLPIQAGKGYSISVHKPDNGPNLPVMLSEGKVAMTPFADELRLAGTLELSGPDRSLDRRRLNGIMNTVRSYLPGMTPTEAKRIWSGLRPCTPDGLPLIGRHAEFRNLTIASGHAMIGVGLAPITGHLVSRIITGEDPQVDMTPLRVDRFR